MFRYHLRASLLVAVTIFVPSITSALQFSEIMYDPAGSDTKREWVEVFNDGDQLVDLSDYGLLENQVNHGINHFSGSVTIAPGQYGIIASDAASVRSEYSGDYSLYDSVFSLNNTGEELKLLDPSDAAVTSINYSSDIGAAGDGNSLNLVSGSLVVRKPTPGSVVSTEKFDDTDTVSTTAKKERSLSPRVSTATIPTSSRVVVPESVIANQNIVFEASVPSRTKVRWNFSDGISDSGSRITRTFEFPGNYSVQVLQIKNGDVVARDRYQIKVETPRVLVATGLYNDQRYLRITNNNSADLNIDNWQVSLGQVDYELSNSNVLGAGDDYAFYLSSKTIEYPITVFDKNNNQIFQATNKTDSDSETAINSSSVDISPSSGQSGVGESVVPESLAAFDDDIVTGPTQEELATLFAGYADADQFETVVNQNNKDEISALGQAAASGLVLQPNQRNDGFSPLTTIINTIMVLMLGVGITLLVSSRKHAFEIQTSSDDGNNLEYDEYEIIRTDEDDF